MMEAVLSNQPTIGRNFVANKVANGDHLTIDNGHTELVVSEGNLMLISNPITTGLNGVVSMKSALMQIDKPYGFVLGGVPLVVIKRADGSADIYTTP